MKMFSIKKKTMIIVGMVALLLVTGYMNYSLNNRKGTATNSNVPAGDEQETGNFFTDFRAERTKNRQQEMSYLDSIIAAETTSADAVTEAQNLKLEITRSMEKETTIEGLLKSKGFSEAVVTFSNDSVNVVVGDSELTQQQVAQVLDIVCAETGTKAENIKVIPQA
jgi:stage III sporulation protein AH